ncbi:ComEA family DNA-binding protein [Teredinibacter waterburyi]|uniref:ComEA family DNA-binding protein n=1 Tax=Teredinibacter waterburyi TaxID=1500538 RepID=UPI00165EED15|nr:helix-hairpin-helix domain-containing protein [Teredinibacter waterburyi]
MTKGSVSNCFVKTLLSVFAVTAILLAGVASPLTFAADKKGADTSAMQKSVTVINLNKADAESIAAALTGVGIKKAQAIVEYRKQKGRIASAEQLLEVKGIGKATLAKNKGRFTL